VARPDAAGGLPPDADELHGHTLTIVNTYLAPTAEFTHDPQVALDPRPLIDAIRQTTGSDHTWELDAHQLAIRQFGDSIMANMIMLGYAWQRGGIPVSAAAIQRALALNGVAVEQNQQAFGIGRLAAARPDALAALADTRPVTVHAPEPLEKVVERCRSALIDYQDARYARQYTDVIDRVLAAERALFPHARPRLAPKVAQSLYKLMAYKDEYEV